MTPEQIGRVLLDATLVVAMPLHQKFQAFYELLKRRKVLEESLAQVDVRSSPDDARDLRREIERVQRQIDPLLRDLQRGNFD